MSTLPLSFFNRPTLMVAKELIGCFLCIKRKEKTERYMITETEAYDGFKDMASHAFRGKTPRNEIMFREGGHIYVYFTYGIHWMLNIITGPKDYPAGVLIRGVLASDGTHYNGPAKLTKKLGVTNVFNGKLLAKKSNVWIEGRKDSFMYKIKKSPRIGVDSSGPVWSKKHYRFFAILST